MPHHVTKCEKACRLAVHKSWHTASRKKLLVPLPSAVSCTFFFSSSCIANKNDKRVLGTSFGSLNSLWRSLERPKLRVAIRQYEVRSWERILTIPPMFSSAFGPLFFPVPATSPLRADNAIQRAALTKAWSSWVKISETTLLISLLISSKICTFNESNDTIARLKM